MKKYKFKIENITEKVIEIEAENNKKAVKKLAGFMAKKGNGNFAKVIGKDNYCYIHLQEISENKNRVLFEDDDEINRDIISNLLSADEIEFEKNDNKNDETKLEEHIEVICERCGNCILLDDIIHHLEL